MKTDNRGGRNDRRKRQRARMTERMTERMEAKVKSVEGIPTPALVLPSYHGHLLYSPPDMAVRLPRVIEELQAQPASDSSAAIETKTNIDRPYQLVLLDVCDVLQKDFGKTALRDLSTVNPLLRAVLSFRSLNGSAVASDTSSVSVNTKLGRKKILLDQYIERIGIEKPAFAVSLADEVNFTTAGHNRLRKSVERTQGWFKSMSAHKEVAENTSLFATVVCDPNHKEQLPNMLEQYLQSGVKGLVIGGIHTGEKAEARHALIASVKSTVQDQVLLMTHNADSIEELLTNIELGVDLIHSGYASLLTQRGCAFIFEKESTAGVMTKDGKRLRAEEDTQEEQPSKRSKVDEEHDKLASALSKFTPAEDGEDGIRIEVDIKPMDRFCINLWDPVFRRDLAPLSKSCECLGCANHTRAYIHHLLKSRELLAEILLYQHNQHQLQQLFYLARQHIKQGTFKEWKQEFLRSSDSQ